MSQPNYFDPNRPASLVPRQGTPTHPAPYAAPYGTPSSPVGYSRAAPGNMPYQAPGFGPQGPVSTHPMTPPPRPGAPTGQDPSANSGALTGPGQAEQFWEQNQGRFTMPTDSQQYFQQLLQSHAPGDADPLLAQYYANAGRQATEKIDSEAAARGAYGSSAALGMDQEALTNLAADRAKAETQNALDWTHTMGSMAGQADTTGLGYLTGGMQGSLEAQGAERNRYNDFFNNEMTMGNAMNGIMAPGFNNFFGSDADLLDASLGMGTAQGTEAQNIAGRNVQQGNQNAVDLSALMRQFAGSFGGGGGGGGGGSNGLGGYNFNWSDPTTYGSGGISVS